MADLTLTAAQVGPVFPSEAEIFDMIAAVAITQGQAVYQNSAGKAALADADAGSGAEQFRGIALNGAGVGQAVSVLKRGHLYGFTLTALAYDGPAYLSNTAGALADTPSTTNAVRAGRVTAMSDANLTKVLYVDAQWQAQAQQQRIFVSTVQTGTGSAQNVAHGLGVIPTSVFIAPVDLSPATTGLITVVEGTHTITNVVVTVTTSKTFKVIAIAG